MVNDRYCEIYGLDCGDHIYDNGVKLQDPGQRLQQEESSESLYGAFSRKSWRPRVYNLDAFFKPGQETDLETFMKTVNNVPQDCRFYPFRNDRFAFVDQAHAYVANPQGANNPATGDWGTMWDVKAEITCREPWLWGADQGLAYHENGQVWNFSSTLTNIGHMPCTLNYLQISGDYNAGQYLTGLDAGFVSPNDLYESYRMIRLCDQLMRDDLFELGWRDGIRHIYDCSFSKLWAEVSTDLHGKTSGGSQVGQTVTLDDGDYFMIPFRGPLPIVGNDTDLQPCLELWISAVSGTGGRVRVGKLADLSDAIDFTGNIDSAGYWKVWLTSLEGSGDLYVGFKANSGANGVTLTRFKGTVNRYLSRRQLAADVTAAIDEDFVIAVRGTGGLKYKFMQAITNYGYFY